MRLPIPALIAPLVIAATIGLLPSVWSTSANEYFARAKPAQPPIEFLGAWGAKGAGPGLLADPRTITTDAFGEVYITDAGASASFIHKFTREGRPLLSFEPLAAIHNPCASAVDLGGAIYSLECGPNALYVFKPEGDLIHTIRGGLAAPAQPSSVTVDNEGRIYVADSHAKRILRYTPRGGALGAWGGKGTSSSGQKGAPENPNVHADQIVASLDGSLFICDSTSGWFARISPAGLIQREWTLPSSGASASAGSHTSSGTISAQRFYLAVTKTSVIAITGPTSVPVLHVFSYDGQEMLSKPLQDLNLSLANIHLAGMAAMQDGEVFILDSASPSVFRLRVNM
ncbi:MAG TPA: NHL repeat-containing protein [Candidatus Acidoferrum sp.]|nr:NHL repeat-containing protein [Candidatus Acidoferrum sp.]